MIKPFKIVPFLNLAAILVAPFLALGYGLLIWP